MAATIIDGNQISADMREEIAAQVAGFKQEYGVTPGLAVVLVGEDPASQVYVGKKEEACEAAGMNSFRHILPEATPEDELLKLIDELNGQKDVHGILVQLPLPDQIDSNKVLYAINPDKDVDGFHPVNVGRLMIGEPLFPP
ncbi:MAG: tetrahydrofolate dehydrogenase/cyclohydrolase catalytic domain-containing protein, partial [Actinomycetota bacterium]